MTGKSCSRIFDPVSPPTLPTLSPQSTIFHRIKQLQGFVSALQYNHTGTQFFEIKKNRPIAGLIDTAREIVKEALPIKCLEAVILAIYLTNTLTNVERFPIGFKSIFDGRKYYHIVLGLYHHGKYGAMGISRRDDLMDKPLAFRSLNDLLQDYNAAYTNYGHTLKKVRLGGAVSHDSCSQERILWTVLNVTMSKLATSDCQKKLDRFTKDLRSQLSYQVMAGTSVYEKMKPVQLSQRTERAIARTVGNDELKSRLETKPSERERRSASADSTVESRKSPQTTRKFHVRV